jgi:hypothetical protein
MAHVPTGRLRPGAGMFYGATAFNGNISARNTARVTTMQASALAVYTEVAQRQESLLAPRPERPSPWPDDQSGPLAMLPSCWANSDS